MIESVILLYVYQIIFLLMSYVIDDDVYKNSAVNTTLKT